MIRRYGEPVRRGMRYRPRPGAYAILLRAGQVLLTHQAEPKPELQLPGGGVDPGEHPIPALHREVLEETGWTISPPRRLGAFRRFAYMPEYDKWADKLCSVWLARPILQLGPPSEPGHTAIWAPLDVAAEVIPNAGERAFLQAVLARGITG